MSSDQNLEITPTETRLSIMGMSCAGCVSAVEGAIATVPGVNSVSVNFADHTALVSGFADPDLLTQSVKSAGYDAAVMVGLEDTDELESQERLHYLGLMKKAAVAGSFGAFLMMAEHFAWLPDMNSVDGRWLWPELALVTLGIMAYSGWHFYQGAVKALSLGQANMDTLIALGTGAAWLFSCVVIDFSSYIPSLAKHAYFEAAVVILAFINLGSALETMARGKTSSAIRKLIGLQPRTARVIREGKEMDIAIGEVGLGEVLRVRPGEKIAVDGVVFEGGSTIDQSMLTGEPIPVEVHESSEVVAGSINGTGTFLYKATRIGRDTALAQIIKSVRQAQSSKPEIARLADKIASVFVPIVVIVALITFALWYFLATAPSLGYAFVTSMTVLVIACPCALGLATPISVMVAVGRAAQSGILIRQGDALQKAGNITCMVLDKTGTITQGKPVVSTIKYTTKFSGDAVLALAASIESGSEHPLATSIINAAKEKQLKIEKNQSFEAIAGQGVVATINGSTVYFGNRALMSAKNVNIKNFEEQLTELSSSGQTPMILAVDKAVAGIIAVSDPIKADSITAVKQLQTKGIKVIMVTGDNSLTAQAVAKQVGINEVKAQVLPQDKASLIKALQIQGEIVGMVGDGINDAPALAQADVGMAIGTGTDVAIESADIVILQGSLLKVPEAIGLSKATVKNIKQNLFGAFFYNTISIPIAAGLLFPFFGILLNPMIAGAAMAMSSLTVVANANRLRWVKL